MEKEVKAEEDGWSVYKQGLAIEDPFELFYDVAHVVKANNFLHIKKEFALAYSKIANEVLNSKDCITGKELIDLICEPVQEQKMKAVINQCNHLFFYSMIVAIIYAYSINAINTLCYQPRSLSLIDFSFFLSVIVRLCRRLPTPILCPW